MVQTSFLDGIGVFSKVIFILIPQSVDKVDILLHKCVLLVLKVFLGPYKHREAGFGQASNAISKIFGSPAVYLTSVWRTRPGSSEVTVILFNSQSLPNSRLRKFDPTLLGEEFLTTHYGEPAIVTIFGITDIVALADPQTVGFPCGDSVFEGTLDRKDCSSFPGFDAVAW
jgi:hypothetical protein